MFRLVGSRHVACSRVRVGGDRRAYGSHSQPREAGSAQRARGLAVGQALQREVRAPVAQAGLGAGAAAQAARAHLPAARLAAHDRLALPALREGDARRRSSTASASFGELIDGKPGEIKARDPRARTGQIVMEKTCAKHGTLHRRACRSIPAFLARIERLYPGARLPGAARRRCATTARRRIKYGRGSVLTVDLTNRCNMMCDPCFMDANQVGYVHELEWDEVKKILDDALTIKPRRQMSVQFSGGEPTLSPLLPRRRSRYAREVGYFCVQCATNGIRFAQEPELRARGEGGGPAHRLPAVRRRRRTRPTRTARSATCST